MNQIKAYFFDRFNTFSLLVLASAVALMLLMLRVKLTHTFFLLFMVWNLFLAFIPFSITAFLKFRPKQLRRWRLLCWTGIWLLFLPNAPYMLTDLVHLFSNEAIFWLDGVILLSFALNGLVLYYISVRDMEKVLKFHLPPFWHKSLFTVLPWLIALGVYVGRFLRWNSWDVITHPIGLISEISQLVTNPIQNRFAWMFVLAFSVVLLSVSAVLQKFKLLEKMA